MKIDLATEAFAIAVGVGDEVAEGVDRDQGWFDAFRNVTDWFRIGLGLAGAVGVSQNMGGPYAEVALHSGSTLAAKTLTRFGRRGFGFSGMRRSVPRARRALPQAVERVSGVGDEEQVLVTVI